MAQLRVAGGVQGMAAASTNPIQQAANVQKSRGPIDLSSPATWAWIWFFLALGYLLLLYFGHGGTRGAVL